MVVVTFAGIEQISRLLLYTVTTGIVSLAVRDLICTVKAVSTVSLNEI